MNKVDIFIVSIPEFDSPIIRDFIHRYYDKFNKIYYVFNYIKSVKLTDLEIEYVNFITEDLKGKCEIVHQHHECFDNHDWRSLSIRNVLEKSNGDYIFSIEPDFFGDWDKIVDVMINKEYDIFTNYTSCHENSNISVRLWPSFWGCKRSLLNQVDMNFSAMPSQDVKSMYKIDYNKSLRLDTNTNKLVVKELNISIMYDHFDYVSTQLVEKSCDSKIILLNNLKNVSYNHITGITHDFFSIKYQNKMCRSSDFYFQFYEHCKKCKVNFYKEWVERSEKIINYKFV